MSKCRSSDADVRRRKKVLEVLIAQYTGVLTGGTAGFYFTNPSRLVGFIVEVFAKDGQATGAHTAHVYTNELWSMSAVAPGSPDVVTNAVVSGRQLPDSYEAGTGVKAFSGTVTAAISASNNGHVYMIRVTWEPLDDDISDDLLGEIFAACTLNAVPNRIVAV